MAAKSDGARARAGAAITGSDSTSAQQITRAPPMVAARRPPQA
ncbi:MAG: hypothetical protein M5U09_04860 [Gammaproteobacteria bacterium]|nr:hypothetical protein [Gammaproteobacteria bacterium]